MGSGTEVQARDRKLRAQGGRWVWRLPVGRRVLRIRRFRVVVLVVRPPPHSVQFFGHSAADMGPNRLFCVFVKETSRRATADRRVLFCFSFVLLSLFVEVSFLFWCHNKTSVMIN